MQKKTPITGDQNALANTEDYFSFIHDRHTFSFAESMQLK